VILGPKHIQKQRKYVNVWGVFAATHRANPNYLSHRGSGDCQTWNVM
jgi:hypothetical protein